MAVSAAQFLVEFPEFGPTNTQRPGLIEAKLEHASRFVSARLWGTRYDRGVYLKAAHLLAMTPYGENARLHKTSPETVYSVLWDQEVEALPARMWIT